MPKFTPHDSDGDKGTDLTVPESWYEPRCHVCTSNFRRAIDRMVALGTSHTEISRIFGGEIDRRSISRHAEKHLNYEEAAIRRIIEEQTAQAEEDIEQGISGATKRRTYLETALHKAFEQLVNDKVIIEPRDAVGVIEALNRFDQQTVSVQLETIKIQFNAFLQAIREIAAQRGDASLGSDILIRARQIAGTEEAAQLPQASQLPPRLAP